ncbi:MAG: mandelate racemase [Variovorax sp.]|nr:MAG: mandelate racemase [Variovorax sp.]
MSASVALRIRGVELFERPVTLRLPFRFGAATVTQCPQAFVRVSAEFNGVRAEGATAELMVPKWFDKSPALTHEQNFEQLREALRIARDSYQACDDALNPWMLSQQCGEAALARGTAIGLPRLVAQFGVAQLDKAVADAALRAAALGWVDGVRAGVLGDPFHAAVPLRRADGVMLRHTVGLADRIIDSDEGAGPGDDLPATLQAALRAGGLTYFKLKLSGRIDADIDRLGRIAMLLDAEAGDYRVTLDGNETFADAASLGAFWQALQRETRLRALLARTLLLEQPLPRAVALQTSIARLRLGVPVILDESDDHPEAFEEGLALGYGGISSKACKGIYRSLANAARIAQEPGAGLLLSGEDLTCQAGLAVQQDCLLASSLGVSHIERNGHHYVDGFGIAPEAEAIAFQAAHPGLYGTAGTRPRLAVRGGRIDLRSLHGAGFGSTATPYWDQLTPIS